jgi:hypothetical protein
MYLRRSLTETFADMLIYDAEQIFKVLGRGTIDD